MPSRIVTANTTAQQVAAERRDAVIRPASISVDNSAGAADRVIRLQDIFTPSATNGVPNPVLTTVDRWRCPVLLGDSINLSREDLAGIKVLGSLNVIADAIDAGCFITVGYEHARG